MELDSFVYFDGLSAAGDLTMPFPDTVKYCILGISVTLLLLALGILAWQVFRCCSQKYTTYMRQDTVNNDQLYSDKKSGTARIYSGAPSTRVENVNTEVRRLSRCLSQASLPSSGSVQADGEMEEQANNTKVEGTLRFSIYYDQLQSQLVVTVLQVEGLLEQSPTRILQPFVKLRLMWSNSEEVEVEECIDEEVRDFDKFSRHSVLGEVRVPLGQLNISYPLELQEDLMIPQKDLVGKVLLSLRILPTSRRLEVGLLKVRTAHSEISSDAALYARISVQCNQSKLRYQKTSAVARCLVTVFNEVAMFSLPEFPLEQCKILVSVYEMRTAKRSPKHLIGQLTVGKEKSSEDKHWSVMMCSVRQPIAKWHGLLI
ncbi:synaptotagmin-2 isoform X2 [Gymnodraco acuticeps]|uniref:Synaptotagmin-2 isoform X2 n=1 Tax=Gymnodraco acuticeps TaxID=8218 RepID=A0A6P8TD28_GYMAC|nr:synaptotagmin-2 isoform X2 [Gymnodraco acuticeps]